MPQPPPNPHLAPLLEGVMQAYAAGDLPRMRDGATQVLAIQPDHPGALHLHGLALGRLGQVKTGLVQMRRAIELNPDYALAWADIGALLREHGHLDQAASALAKAARLEPRNIHSLHHLGQVVFDGNRVQDAARVYRQLVSLQPEQPAFHFHLALALLKLGRWGEGFQEYEWRWRLPAFPTQPLQTDRPRWDGGDLGGRTILLQAEQGFGDAIQFCRYATTLAQGSGARVLIQARRALHPLLATIPGVSGVFDRELPAFDCHCPTMSLPLLCGTQVESVPAAPAYLSVEPARAQAWGERIRAIAGARRRIGIIWRTDQAASDTAAHRTPQARSTELKEWEPLLATPNTAFFVIQHEVTAEERVLLQRHGCHEFSPAIDAFGDAAALMAQMDLVIGIDTAAIHIAAALGRPTWVLLPVVADWRWLMDREDTPWYPAMRLFRRSAKAGWGEVLGRVAGAL